MAEPAHILMTAPMAQPVIDAIESRFTLHRLWQYVDRDAFLNQIAPHVRGIAASTLAGPLQASLLDRLPHTEIISSFGVGYDHIDAREAARRGIVVTNTPGVLDDEVADLGIGLLLAVLRQIPQADQYVREGKWPAGAFPLSPTLRGRKAGILGLGAIGQAIARRLEAFGVSIAYHNRNEVPGVGYEYCATAVDLARACDLLIVIVPGGAGTRHLIDAPVLEALGPQGVLINISRGSVVDEPALIAALEGGKIWAAGLDVYDDEPHVPAALVAMPQCVLLPHIGSASAYTRAAMGQLVVDNLIDWFDGKGPRTPVSETAHLARG